MRSNKELSRIIDILNRIKGRMQAPSFFSPASRGPKKQLNDGETTSAAHGSAHNSATSSRGLNAPSRHPGK